MTIHVVSLTEAKARLSELADLAESGESVIITRHGRPVLRLVRPEIDKVPIDARALADLTASLPAQPENAGEFIRKLREQSRY